MRDISRGCEIQLDRVTALAGDEVSLGLVRLSESAIYLENRDRVAVFDLEGRFQRHFGREGMGPGEYTNIQDLRLTGDGRLAVVEVMPPRVTLLAPTGAVERTFQLPVMISRGGATVLPDGSYLLGGRMLARSFFGSPMVVVDSAGRVLQYLGENEVETEGFAAHMMIPRIFDHDPNFGVVAVKSHKYEVEVWGLGGELVRRFARDVPWFGEQPDLTQLEGHAVGEPTHAFTDLDLDADGRVWLLARVAGQDWQSGVREGRLVDRDAWTDHRIEVLDLRSRAVLCSTLYTGRMVESFPASGHVATYDEDDRGNPTIVLWRANLVFVTGVSE